MGKRKWKNEDYLITIDKDELDVDVIHDFLSNESYWSKGISREDVMKSIHHSAICFGMYYLNPTNKQKHQIGFARVISDLVTHAYIQDVFILSEYRKKGLGVWLLNVITNDEDLQIRRIMLSTEDGHSFYSKFGFSALDKPSFFMQIKGEGAI